MKSFISINRIVKLTYENTKKEFFGTMYKNDFYFYHNALTLMTSRSCKEYITRTGITNHWVLLQRDNNKQTKFFNRPIGNSPEVMPIVRNLNKDLHEGANWLCCLTNRLDNTDLTKFSKTTPKQMLSA